jgi:hypothetical protein
MNSERDAPSPPPPSPPPPPPTPPPPAAKPVRRHRGGALLHGPFVHVERRRRAGGRGHDLRQRHSAAPVAGQGHGARAAPRRGGGAEPGDRRQVAHHPRSAGSGRVWWVVARSGWARGAGARAALLGPPGLAAGSGWRGRCTPAGPAAWAATGSSAAAAPASAASAPNASPLTPPAGRSPQRHRVPRHVAQPPCGG